MDNQKIKKGYIFRIDDITPGMNWDNFDKIEKIFDLYGVKPIIGVVPDNKDKGLGKKEYDENFWKRIQGLHKKGWTVAQHGYQHKYTNKNSGIIGLNNYGEFAGIPYQEQYEKIKIGKEILENKLGFASKWWMAPAHSFDKNTCIALKNLGFEYITDGIALWPFEKYGLKWLPQQIWKPQKKVIGIWTICLHINDYNDKFIKKIEKFCEENVDFIIDNPKKILYIVTSIKKLLNFFFVLLFRSKIYLYKFKNKLLG